ncbi:MAG: EMC3/TMCO1 family protein [Candidatus Thorarchaeota archaeon]|nr:EMC3/TMCO1 family protein [Candidatus Thorarchaeota archaeon]
MQDLFTDFAIWFATAFQLFQKPPFSALFIMLVSVVVSTMSNLAMKRFSDMRRLQRQQLEIKQYQEMEKEAKRTQNEKLLKKVKRRKAYIDRIQREQLSSRCKPSLIFLIPFMLIFTILRGFYTIDGTEQIVAVIPFNLQKVLPFLVGMGGRATEAGFGLTYYIFYFIVGLGLSSILQRIMGTQVMAPQT